MRIHSTLTLSGHQPKRSIWCMAGLSVLLFFSSFSVFLPNPQAAATGSGSLSSKSRGYIVSTGELRRIKEKAGKGVEPYKSNLESFNKRVTDPWYWPYGSIWGEFKTTSDGTCFSTATDQGDNYLNNIDGGTLVYEKVLAYHLTGNETYAKVAREKIVDLTDTWGFGGDNYSGNNQCILDLAFSVPLWIQSADLLEDSSVWTWQDKDAFQNWLKKQVYPKVAWASRNRVNNWGIAGSLSAAMIADYLSDRSFKLAEKNPYRELTIPEAYREHNTLQKQRLTGGLQTDGECQEKGITAYGGMPEELRRGSTGCEGKWIYSTDSSYRYTIMSVELLIFHSEFLLRRKDNSLYEHKDSYGKGSIKNSIYFVVSNPTNSREWDPNCVGTLYIANKYYKNWTIGQAAKDADETFKGGVAMPYGKLTHTYASDENPGWPPFVEAPR